MSCRRRTRLLIAGAIALTLAGCSPARRPAATPTPYSDDPRLIPKLDPVLALPQYPCPSPNGYEVFEKLTKKINQGHELKGDFSGGSCHPIPRKAELAAAPAQLADNREVLAELRQALRMEWLNPHPPRADLLSPEVFPPRYLARLLTWDAEIKARAGDADAAVADLVDALTLAVKLPRGGGLMHWLVGRASENTAFRALCPMVAGHRLSPEMLTSLSRQLLALQRQKVPLREIIAFDYECQGPQTLNLTPSQFMELRTGRGAPLWLRLALHLPRAGAVTRSFIGARLPDLMKWDAKLAHFATQPYYAIRDQIPTTGGDSEASVLCPFPRGAVARQAESQVRWQGLQVMIALELQRNRRGAYPPNLKALRGFTAEQLQDPFSGKPLAYKSQGASYTLYSIGEDREDNGGRATTRPADPHTDVVVWPARAD